LGISEVELIAKSHFFHACFFPFLNSLLENGLNRFFRFVAIFVGFR
jgi:hypothetical protein